METQRAADAHEGWPKWIRIGGPIVILLSLIAGCGSPDEAAEPASNVREATTTDAPGFADVEDVDLDGVVDDALGDASVEGLGADVMASMIRQTCQAAEAGSEAGTLAASLSKQAGDDAEVRDLVEAVGTAAETFCPAAVAISPDLLNALYADAVAANMTTTTAAPTTSAPATTLPPTTLPPTTAPPPPPPAPVLPPAPVSGANYANCDAARAAGAAPLYRGDPGYRSGLDRDDDGVACE